LLYTQEENWMAPTEREAVNVDERKFWKELTALILRHMLRSLTSTDISTESQNMLETTYADHETKNYVACQFGSLNLSRVQKHARTKI
jgi:hypothetical protein